MRQFVLAFALTAMPSIAWCQQPQPRTAGWFLANPDQIPAVRQWCHEHPDALRGMIEQGNRACLNVEEVNCGGPGRLDRFRGE